MKSESYNALADLNRGFDMVLGSLKVLQENGVVTAEFVSDNSTFIQLLWSNINWMIVHKLNAREMEDRDHFGILQDTIEKRRKRGATIATTGDSRTDASRENGQRAQDGAEGSQRSGIEGRG